MHLLQRAKVPMPLLRKAQVTKLSLVFACLLLCLAAVCLLGGAGTVYAASIGANIKPAATGGGCASSAYLKACISENSEGYIVSDAYILYSNVCSVAIILVEDGHEVAIDSFGSKCFVAGTHLSGFSVGTTAGHTWMTSVIGAIGTQSIHVDSPYLYT